MEMSLKRSTLLVLAAVAAVAAVAISHQNLVFLDGKKWTVPVNSSVTLYCNLSPDSDRFRVNWRFNRDGPFLSNSTNIFENMYTKSSKKDDVMKYTFSNFNETNQGWYFCNITTEIPLMTHKNSVATEIIILKSTGHTTYPSLPIVTSEQDHQPFMERWMWITLLVAAFVLIVLLVVCAVLRRKGRSSREDPIYANTRSVVSKQPSPRPGGVTDNLKADSSTENLRNPSPGQRYGEGKRRPKP